ncbi:MAG: acyl-CoA dehydrogenase [Burkholderiaceae bacterium]|nr:acyl-CoA dehydrogenase [Burkholderiaceae bacterium]
MNFDLSEDDAALQDSVARWVQQRYPFDARRKLAARAPGFSREHWREMAQLGWLALPFDEGLGGLGGGPLAMEQLGKGLVLEPYLPSVLLFGGLMQRSAALRDEWVPKVIDGSVLGALACFERDSRHDLTDVQTRLQPAGDGWRLDGDKVLVFNGAAADQLIVTARSSGDRFDSAGLSLVRVDAGAAGVERTPLQLMDGQWVANLRLRDVKVAASQLLFAPGDAWQPLRATVDQAMLALCAEGFGVMQRLHAATLDYFKTRKQFGVTIGSFQVLQHRLVDMFAALEQTRSLLIRAVCSADAGSAEARRDLLALKVMVGKAGRLIGGEAVQMHGGMGMTDELIIGHGMKRLMVIDASFGNAEVQRAHFAALAA